MMASSNSQEKLPVDKFRAAKKSDCDIFEETVEVDVNEIKEQGQAVEIDHKTALKEEKVLVIETATASKYADLKPECDYRSRPHIPDMDWANCSWADPDDSL